MRKILALLILLAIPAVAQFGGPMGGMRPGSMQGGGLLPGRGGDPLWVAAGPTKPKLDLDFAKRKDLTDAVSGKTSLVTFSRSAAQSPGTYVGADGLIHDAAVNLALYSEQFDNAYWVPLSAGTGSAPIKQANQAIAPDGKQTADKVVFDLNGGTASGDFSFIYGTYPGVAGTSYTVSVWIRTDSGTADIFVDSDSQNSKYATATTEWTRVTTTRTTSVTGTRVIRIGLRGNVATSDSATVYLWGAQLEETDAATMAPTAYVHTTSQALAAPRFDHDPVTGESLGLLVEEQRANLVANSDQVDGTPYATGTGTNPIVTFNYGVAPDGTMTADRIQVNRGSGTSSVDVSVAKAYRTTHVSGDNVMTSFYVKSLVGDAELMAYSVLGGVKSATFNINSEWQRVSFLSNTAGSTTNDVWIGSAGGSYGGDQTLDFLVWGIQAEKNVTFPTSYIPTEGTSQTRYADIAAVQDEDFSTTNLISYSESFDVGWSAARLRPVTANATAAPDGQTTADYIEQAAGQTNAGVVYQTKPLSGDEVTSVYAKAAEKSWLRIQHVGGASAYFNLANCEVGTTAGPFFDFAAIEDVGDGWCRLFLGTNQTTAGINIGFYLADADNSATVTDSGGIYLWGASLTATEYPVAYTTTRNLLTDSQDFERSGWVKSGVTIGNDVAQAPDGTLTADKLDEQATTAQHWARQYIAVSAGTYTFSTYAKQDGSQYLTLYPQVTGSAFAAFDLQAGAVTTTGGAQYLSSAISDAGNGWWRISITTTATAGTMQPVMYIGQGAPTYLGVPGNGVLVWGSQLEPGSTATDYVRTVDVVGKRYGWFEPTEGTVFVEAFNSRNVGTSHTLYGISDGTNSYRVQGYLAAGSVPYALSSIPTTYSIARSPPLSFPSTYRHAYGIGFGGHTIAANGNSSTSSVASFAPPSGLNVMYIGQRGDGAQNELAQKHIKRLTYWPVRQADSTLQVITQ